MNAIFQRVSVRDYKSTEVEEEKVELLLKAAMAAPSAGNQRPWEFFVVKRKDLLERLSMSSPYAGCTKYAPIAIVPCYNKKRLKHADYAEIDMSAATENILLEATDLGLGAVWLGIAPIKERMDAVKELLHLPEDLEAFAIVPCGYPKEEKKQIDRYQKEWVQIIE